MATHININNNCLLKINNKFRSQSSICMTVHVCVNKFAIRALHAVYVCIKAINLFKGTPVQFLCCVYMHTT
jgi:hypothetical protein